jgi:hypothetical protein
MARGSSRISSSQKTCPPTKFSFLSGCTSWTTILAFITLVALLIILVMVMYKKTDLTSNGKFIMMIENNLSAKQNTYPTHNTFITTKSNTTTSNTTHSNTTDNILQRPKSLFEPYDPLNDNHNNTGTANSERIQYDINVNIRDQTSYQQNPNLISYARYEADKNIERIINPILPPERSYVNTYGVPINIPSRGPQQSYQQVGILYKENIENPEKLPGNNNESNILPLFGRPTYAGSNKWNYYTSSDKFQTVKLPINIDGRKCTDDTGCNEIMNGDMISIPSYNGRFKVEIYDFDRPRYIPYVY